MATVAGNQDGGHAIALERGVVASAVSRPVTRIVTEIDVARVHVNTE